MLTLPITASALGANVLLAAQPGRRIRVLGFLLSAAGAVNVQFQDGAANNLSGVLAIPGGAYPLVAPIGPAVSGSELYWMITATSQSLVLNLSAAVACGGVLIYDVI